MIPLMSRLALSLVVCVLLLGTQACSDSPLNEKASYQYYASPFGEQEPVWLLITKMGDLEMNTIDDTLRSVFTESEKQRFEELVQQVPVWDTTYNSAKNRIEQKLSRSDEDGIRQLRITRGSDAPAPSQELVNLLDEVADRMRKEQ